MSAASDKISKLLNMTVENGCTEDEQETALRMAASIAAREGIDLDACRPKDAPKPKAKGKRVSMEMKPHQAYAAVAAAVLYGIECNAHNLGKYGVFFVGRENLIELAEETMFWLFRQIEELYKTSLPKGLTQRARAEYRKTFKAACAMRILDRARKLMSEMKAGTSGLDMGAHNALTVVGHFKTLDEEIDLFWKEYMTPSPEHLKEMAEIAAARAQWEAENPEEAEKQRKAAEREAAKEAKRAAKRKGPRERQMPVGSGTQAGYVAGGHAKLRKELS